MRVRLVLPCLFVCALASQAADRGRPLADMVQSELDFAAKAAGSGMKAAFLEYLSVDSITFSPGPVKAREEIESGPDVPGSLEWYPEYALVSSRGDLGLSTGPYVSKAPGRPDSFGHFTTLWRREADGRWRAAFDAGIRHAAWVAPPDRLDPARLSARTEDDTRATTPEGANESSLRAADRAFSESARELGYSASLRKMAHPDVRLQRSGSQPITGMRAASALMRGSAPVGDWTTDFAASSGDFGYTYGRVMTAGADGKPRASDAYLRVWQYADGQWKLVLDQVTEIPE